MIYFHAGSHNSQDIEVALDVSESGQRSELVVYVGGQRHGTISKYDLQQLVQYLVIKGAVDVNELKELKEEKV